MKMLKIYGVIAALFLMFFQASVRASGEEIIFSPDKQTNIVLVNSTAVTETTVSGVKAYSVNLGQSLYFNINDAIIYQNPGHQNVEIDVSYYDTGCGWFRIMYDGENGSDTVYNDDTELYNTNKIITRTIRLEDAYFGNRGGGGTADLMINVPNSDDGKALCITALQVRVLPSKSCIKIDAQSGAYGNIFFDDDSRTFSVEYSNKSSGTIPFNVCYEIKNTDKTVTYHSETKSFTVSAASSVKDSYSLSAVSKYGTYLLCINASGGDGQYESVLEIPFSFCVGKENGGVNSRIGVNGHFNTGRESENGMKILRKAGFGNIRDAYYWAEFEAKKGVYAETANCTECYTNAEANGMDILILAAYSNTNYCETERHIPATDEEREAFANYVHKMLEARNGKVNVVEIWNEPNLAKFNENALSSADYVKFLKAVYEKIKPDYPNVKIGAPAISSVDYINTWLKSMLEADIDGDGSYDAYKYFDVLTLHHYCSSKLPQVVGLIKPLFSYLEQYGCADKQVYHTEFGVQETVDQYNSITGKGTMLKLGDEEQARRLSQYYLLLQGNNLGDRFFIYNFSNNGLLENVQSYSAGLVKPDNYRVPYAAKPALLAMANVNNLLKNTDSAEVVQSGNVNVLKYSGADLDKEVYAFFTFGSESIYTFTPEWETVEFLDVYGNRLDIPSDNGSYTLNISGSPVYAVKNIGSHGAVSFARKGENIVASGTFNEAKAGDYVGVEVFDANKSIVSIGQLTLDSTKKFSYEFTPADLNSEFSVHFGTQTFGEVYMLDFKGAELKQSVIRAYVNQAEAASLSDIINSESVTIEASIYDDTVTDFVVACASYKDNTLGNVRLISKNNMTINNGIYSTNISASEFTGADRVSIFMLDSLNNILPLAEALHFN